MTARTQALKDWLFSSLGLSVSLHFGIFVLLFVRAALFPNEPIQIRSAIRVDVVDLPDKVTAPAPVSAPTPPPPVEVPKPVVEMPKMPEPTKPSANPTQVQQKALEKLKALQAIERLKTEQSEKAANAKPQVFKGNVISQGNSLTGLEKIEYDRYFGEIEKQIRTNWNLPQWLIDANFKAQAVVMIDERGFVIKKQLLKTSGNEVFDGKVLEAIDRSSPFPEPPARLRGVLSARGVVFNFPE